MRQLTGSLEDRLKKLADEGSPYSHQALRPDFVRKPPINQYEVAIKTPAKFLTRTVAPRRYVKRPSVRNPQSFDSPA